MMIPILSSFVLLAHGETDPCSTEEEVRESNGDQPAAVAMQEVESSVDSGVDEKVCCARLPLDFLLCGSLLVSPSSSIHKMNMLNFLLYQQIPIISSSAILVEL